MDKTELKKELREALIRQSQNIRDADKVEQVTEKLKAEISALEKQLAEAEKPKLRHGDYGVDYSGYPGLEVRLHSNGELKEASGLGVHDNIGSSAGGRPDNLYGNIFDDIAELKPVDSFEMTITGLDGTNLTGNVLGSNEIRLTMSRERRYLSAKQLHEYIMYLRSMEIFARQSCESTD